MRKSKKCYRLEPREQLAKQMAKQSSFYNSLSGFDKKSVTPVRESSECSSKSDKEYEESSFEFGILGKGYPSDQFLTARTPFLKKFWKKNPENILPYVRPATPGILNPLRVKRTIVRGRFIDLEKPPNKMVEFYGATSKLY